jgi:asparagine synthase (glutamine-hydrolysing)
MCGIFGAINLTDFFNQSNYEQFVNLTDLVHYRGPDASGYLALNVKGQGLVNDKNKFDVFLGHRRLAIIDLSERANQPLTDDKGLWIVFNGEIYNYIELRQALIDKGYSFKTDSDTEVILNIYKEYTETGFTKLNGDWALAIVDLPYKKIVLSRDRFSVKPLYFTKINHQFYFASEIKQLLSLVPKKEINQNIIFAYLNQGLLDHNEQTFYLDINKLKPKYNLIIQMDSARFEERKYWDYELPEPLSWNKAVEKFRELFIDSVRIRLRSDVKVDSLLSGGLDSSAITIIADALSGGKCSSYSVVFGDKRYSEERFVDIVLNYKQIKGTKLYLQSQQALKNLEEIIYYQDEPFVGFSAVAQYNILERIKKEVDVTVLLSGQGGDEGLLGYNKFFFFYLKDLISKGRIIKALNQISASFFARTILRQFNFSEARRYIPFLQNKKCKPFLKIKGEIEPLWQYQTLRERQIFDIDKYSVPALTHYEDRNSMAHSLEIRLPFLDYRLLNLLINLPTEMKIKGAWTKHILRKSLSELPQEILWRKDKQGFITPEREWLKKDFKSLIQKTFNKSMLDKMGIINDKLFLKYYQDFINGRGNIWYTDISRMLIAELWTKKFLV